LEFSLDTRSKIVNLEEAKQRAAGLRAVCAYCDPLLPSHMSKLKEKANGRGLLVVLRTPEDAYLEAGARAELAASLSFVDAVVIGDAESAAALHADEALCEEEGRLRTEFLEFVRDRARS
jgi:hypothetical protein